MPPRTSPSSRRPRPPAARPGAPARFLLLLLLLLLRDGGDGHHLTLLTASVTAATGATRLLRGRLRLRRSPGSGSVQWFIGDDDDKPQKRADKAAAPHGRIVREGVEFYSNGDCYEGEFHKDRRNGARPLEHRPRTPGGARARGETAGPPGFAARPPGRSSGRVVGRVAGEQALARGCRCGAWSVRGAGPPPPRV